MFNFSDESAVLAAAKKILENRLRKHETTFTSPDDLRDYLLLQYAGKEREEFNVLFLDAKNHLLASETMFTGTVATTAVHVREVAKHALLHNATGVIIAHNHPSGDSTPSPQDYQMTELVRKALATVEVNLLDHLVVGGNDVHSIEENRASHDSGFGTEDLLELLGLTKR